MKRLSDWNSSQLASIIAAVIIALVPFQGFLTVWGSTIVGHYTALRLWNDLLLVALVGICAYWLTREAELRVWFTGSLLVRLVLAYAGLTLLLAVVSYVKDEVSLKAAGYGVLINLRFLAWFLGVLLTAQRSPFLRREWPRLLLVPAAFVVVFGALQYTVLSHTFLSHFGYNAATTIAPIETINHNQHFIRVQSTLRGANPLGAYLVIVLSALGVLFVRGKRKVLCAVFGLAAFAVLYASGSRSAWIGTLLSLCVIAWSQVKTRRNRLIFGGVGLAVLILATTGYLLLKNNVTLQNELLHTQTHSAVKTTSNGAHASAIENGLSDVLRQPLGDGPGTAGPASQYNTGHPARIAEDYYVQIAQETGWIGVALFLCILALVAVELYGQVGKSRLALILFASFVGVAFVNMLSHAWADDTLAFIWWGFAGIALGAPLPKTKRAAKKV